jgi:outer membrane beta-barrel protein
VRRLKALAITSAMFFVTPPLLADRVGGGSGPSGVVMKKDYPRDKRIEINGPDVGIVLNQSYINSTLIHIGANYYTSEVWGFGLEAAFALNQDKSERTCIESFFNNFDHKLGTECNPDPSGNPPSTSDARWNYGPAYVPIRELKTLFAATAIWTPVYAKQLMMLSSVNHFDLYLTIGGGLAMSDYYEKSTVLANGKNSRGPAPAAGITDGLPGAGPDEAGPDGNLMYGKSGRPAPRADTDLYITGGIGQKYHFLGKFNFKIEFRDYLLVGTDAGFDNFIALWTGLGMRF